VKGFQLSERVIQAQRLKRKNGKGSRSSAQTGKKSKDLASVPWEGKEKREKHAWGGLKRGINPPSGKGMG